MFTTYAFFYLIVLLHENSNLKTIRFLKEYYLAVSQMQINVLKNKGLREKRTKGCTNFKKTSSLNFLCQLDTPTYMLLSVKKWIPSFYSVCSIHTIEKVKFAFDISAKCLDSRIKFHF